MHFIDNSEEWFSFATYLFHSLRYVIVFSLRRGEETIRNNQVQVFCFLFRIKFFAFCAVIEYDLPVLFRVVAERVSNIVAPLFGDSVRAQQYGKYLAFVLRLEFTGICLFIS